MHRCPRDGLFSFRSLWLRRLKFSVFRTEDCTPKSSHAPQNPTSRTDKTVRRGVSRLVARYGRSITRRDQVTLERVDRLRAYLAPEGAPQERIYGPPYYASRLGTHELKRLVLEACVPFSGGLKDLRP